MLHPDLGCALAAMGTEMARMPRGMKLAVSKALDAYAERLDFLMPGETAAQRSAAFLVLFPSMAGCITAARAHASKERQRQILAAGRSFFERSFCGEQMPAFLETMQ
jgi:TetR/AcrR family transcriptional repressor of nem operon